MTECIYSKYNIDPTKLSRDYLKNPLTKISKRVGGLEWERPVKEDLYYLYIELNLSYVDLYELLRWGETLITRWNKLYNIKKSSLLHTNNIKKTKLKRHGSEIYTNRDKAKKTCLEKYGVDHYSKTNEYKEKTKKTCLKKHGNKNYRNTNKKEETNLEKYGVKHYCQTEKFRKQSKQTCLEKYGRNNVGQFGSPEHKKAILEKYGVKNYNNKPRQQTTMMGRYGVEYYSKTDEFKNLWKNKEWVKNIQQKIYFTKKKNNSFTKSKPEDDYYKSLCEKYGKDNVVRQYKSELYPFNCDFYIPSEDLYIEYNGHWGHYTEPYDPNKKEHQLLLENWKQKEKESDNIKSGKKSYYTYAIETWTVSDPLKRETSKKNNLNFIEIW